LQIEQLTSIALCLLCFGSFAWGMRKFFLQPSGYTVGMKVTTSIGLLFAAGNFISLILPAAAGQHFIFGSLFYLASLSLFWWAIRTNYRKPLSAVFSSDQPAHLVKDGPYRIVRHPFYASYMLSWIAGPVASGYLWLWIAVIVMLVLYIRAAHFEERKFSSSPLAGEYDLYRTRTGLMAPNPLKLALSTKRSRAMINASGLE
jgi:protein-S-isoprenylcysteine O-methyltransferase Ste14